MSAKGNMKSEGTKVVASAPGKVILFGEHAVVYGKMAVAAAVSDMRIVVEVTSSADEYLHLELPDLSGADGKALCLHKPVEDVAAFFSSPLTKGLASVPPTVEHVKLLESFLGDFEAAERKALIPLMFLCLALVPGLFLGHGGPGAKGLFITAFSASLPVGAGLGSSAAFCVASSAALLRLGRLLGCGGRGQSGSKAEYGANAGHNGHNGGNCNRPPRPDLEEINSWAYAAETLLHGNPSGLDNTVSCFGGAIKYLREPKTTEAVKGFPCLDILLTNTHVPRETRAMVEGVGCLRDRFPGPTNLVFEAIEGVAAAFLGGAVTGSLSVKEVGELATMNHHLLCALRVSHPALDRVRVLAEAYGCDTKLTGAGGGGCALTFLGEDLGERKEKLVADLECEGFSCHKSSIGGIGVLWHDTVPEIWGAPREGAGEKLVDNRLKGSRGRRYTWILVGVVAASSISGAVAGAAIVALCFGGCVGSRRT